MRLFVSVFVLIFRVENLRSAGDTVLRVEGVLSAFLSYVFNRLSPGPGSSEEPVVFSKACWEAAEKGKRCSTAPTAIYCQ